MSASPKQMLHSGFNVSVPTQGALISHPGSMHQMTPMHISQGGSSHASSHVASSPTTPATYVTTSSQWPVTNDGACTFTVSQSLDELAKEHEASVKESGLPLVVSSPLIVSSQQRNFNVSQQPMVTDLGDGDSGCHPVSHIHDQTMQNIDIQEVSQELHSPVVLEPQQQNLESSQQSQQVHVDMSHNADHIQHTVVDIQNTDIDVHRDSVQISPAHSGNDIHEDIFPQDAQVTDEIVAEELQGDSAILDDFQDGFQAGNAIEPVGEIEPDGDGTAVSFLWLLCI
ncbi:hypothetical protein V6N11_001934 [Hibiscus sabdariffa]|uniref:Uncharacterized protein n=1 Tax=Hibiscus sabdariffa TaxID=183260 RepID=A0ABR2QTV8_9ROSI